PRDRARAVRGATVDLDVRDAGLLRCGRTARCRRDRILRSVPARRDAGGRRPSDAPPVLVHHRFVPRRGMGAASRARQGIGAVRLPRGARSMSDRIVLRADRWVDVEAGEVRSPAVVVVEGNRIEDIGSRNVSTPAEEIDLGDVALLPGLMDMEINLLLGGPNTASPV